MHNIVPVNSHSSISGFAVSWGSNVCPIFIDLVRPIFRNLGALANTAVVSDLEICTLQLCRMESNTSVYLCMWQWVIQLELRWIVYCRH